jgi:succinate dehydrogenase / fumarate reductase, cytochrome b subunit
LNSTTKHPRPLSPFWIYRWQYTMALSILHRVTGCALSVGMLLFVYWLVALATGEEAYVTAQSLFAHPLIKLSLYGFSFAFFYHLVNGIRHLVWDTGRMLERKAARTSGWVAFITAIVVTVLFWIFAANLGGGAA